MHWENQNCYQVTVPKASNRRAVIKYFPSGKNLNNLLVHQIHEKVIWR